MIKKGLKNFLVNLKYLFTPLGALSLGVVLGLSALISGTAAEIKTLSDKVVEITGDMEIDYDALKESVFGAVRSLDWTQPFSALKTLLSVEWLSSTFNSCIGSLVSGGDSYVDRITLAVDVALGGIKVHFTVFVLWSVLGLFGGYFLTKFLIRRNMARRAWWKYFLATFVESLLGSLFAVFVVRFQFLWEAGGILSALCALVLISLGSLIEAHILHGWKKVDSRKILNPKNIFTLMAVNLIIFAIAIAVIIILFVALNAAAALFLSVALLEIMFIVCSMNAESYVKSVAEQEAEANECPSAADTEIRD